MELPFECEMIDTQPVEIKNMFSGKTCLLPPDAVAVYDTIKGAEMLGDYETVRKGLYWFMDNYPKEYMILLD